MPFRALVLQEGSDRQPRVQTLDEAQLPEGDVRVAVQFSSLNYKDAMILNGRGGLVKTYPHVPGIDLGGVVLESASAQFEVGAPVLLTGWRVGEIRWGGLAETAQVNSRWLVRLPTGLTLEQAMAFGTAGLTAMLCVMALEDRGIDPSRGEVLVTGAAGGVGSVAVGILAALGYNVAASTGRAETHAFLKSLGASRIVARSELANLPDKPLLPEKWAAAVDAVGGGILARMLASTSYGGSVAACGLTAGATLTTSIIPFLLRAVALIGIDSVQCTLEERHTAWSRLASGFPKHQLESIATRISLQDVPAWAARMLEGQVRGRVVVDVRRT